MLDGASFTYSYHQCQQEHCQLLSVPPLPLTMINTYCMFAHTNDLLRGGLLLESGLELRFNQISDTRKTGRPTDRYHPPNKLEYYVIYRISDIMLLTAF